MLLLRRWLKLPTPVELGWSDVNALGMREFTPYQEGNTWDDWQEHCQKHYPVRYFLAEVFPFWFDRWFMWPLGRLRDWVLDHCLPSRRYHVFDLRGIDPLWKYRHGYVDPSHVFWLAGWGSLVRWYRESAADKDPRSWMTAEQQADPMHHAQLKSYDELVALHHYWTVTRIERDQRCTELYNAANAVEPTAENRERYEAVQAEWLEHYRESQTLDESMWLRLAAMRAHLWD